MTVGGGKDRSYVIPYVESFRQYVRVAFAQIEEILLLFVKTKVWESIKQNLEFRYYNYKKTIATPE